MGCWNRNRILGGRGVLHLGIRRGWSLDFWIWIRWWICMSCCGIMDCLDSVGFCA